MKEMMAKARESKETQEKKKGVFKDTKLPDEDDEYFKNLAALADQKFKDKQAGKEETQQIDSTVHEKTYVDEINQEFAK